MDIYLWAVLSLQWSPPYQHCNIWLLFLSNIYAEWAFLTINLSLIQCDRHNYAGSERKSIGSSCPSELLSHSAEFHRCWEVPSFPLDFPKSPSSATLHFPNQVQSLRHWLWMKVENRSTVSGTSKTTSGLGVSSSKDFVRAFVLKQLIFPICSKI